MFNLTNKDCQAKFRDLTTKSTLLSSSFRKNEYISISSNRFMKILSGLLHVCFKKIRIGNTLENPEIQKLSEMRRVIKKKAGDNKKKLEEMC